MYYLVLHADADPDSPLPALLEGHPEIRVAITPEDAKALGDFFKWLLENPEIIAQLIQIILSLFADDDSAPKPAAPEKP